MSFKEATLRFVLDIKEATIAIVKTTFVIEVAFPFREEFVTKIAAFVEAENLASIVAYIAISLSFIIRKLGSFRGAKPFLRVA